MTPSAFNPIGPLPDPGTTTVLEASAGTGKTHAIAGLAVRFIAEAGVDPARMLLVTFGRNATRELRERVRTRLTRTRDALLDPSHPARQSDEVVEHLVARSDPLAAIRLAGAVAAFDSLTIATTHQFAGRSLRGLGLLGDFDSGESLLADQRQLLTDVLDDFYVRKYGGSKQLDPGVEPLAYKTAAEVARAALDDPQSVILGLAELRSGTPMGSASATTRIRLAAAARAEAEARRRAERSITYDDLVSHLAQTLRDPVGGALARARLARAHEVVLVDEFQDTDPLQWQIVAQAFHGCSTLVLIGDPKQAIYAFRGADVHSYLQARAAAQVQQTLATNHRSDGAVVAGVAQLVENIELGDPKISVGPVATAAGNAGSRLLAQGWAGLAGPQRVRLRLVSRDRGATAPVAQCRQEVLCDLVGHITGLLRTARLDHQGAARALAPGDIAVLVGTNKQAELVREALGGAGVAAVIHGTVSVFASRAARTWLDLLQALERPRPKLVRAVVIGDLFGFTAWELGTQGDAVAEQVGWQLRRWSHTLQTGSVAAMQNQIESETNFTARLLGLAEGERAVTDLHHIGALLHHQQRSTGAGAPGLAAWLAAAIREANAVDREGSPELVLRLDTDAEAVQVLTIHRAKGMQFPVCYLPFAWDRYVDKNLPEVLRCHDPAGQRIIDVRGHVPGRGKLVQAYQDEEAGESLRALYVGLTRASSLVVVHWAGSSQNTAMSPLHRVLCARSTRATQPKPTYPVGAPPTDWLAGSVLIAVESADSQVQPGPAGPFPTSVQQLQVAPYVRSLDTSWRRTSFTALTSDSHDATGAREAATADMHTDEPEDPLASAAATSSAGAGWPFLDLPGGTTFGTLVHSILENLRTDGPDLPLAVSQACQAGLSAHPIPGVAMAGLAPALLAAVSTSLGPLADGLSLARIPTAQRLAELDFELPLGHGPDGPSDVRAIAELMREHLADDDPLVDYPAELAALPTPLHGFLAGSIDAVLRVGSTKEEQRYLVVDYKTNRLHGTAPGRLDGPQAYRPDRLPAAMIASHYPLQALLYSAALHRYLRWRQPAYDPHQHLGGVLYLFLRGMAGPDTPTHEGVPYGVFSWTPPVALVLGLSDLLAGGVR